MGHTPFKLNYSYYPCVSLKNKYDICTKSFFAKKLAIELKELMNVCYQNLLHAQNLYKQAHDKGVKPQSYAPDEKIWLNSKHIKTKKN